MPSHLTERSRSRPKVAILGADQKERGFWGRECSPTTWPKVVEDAQKDQFFPAPNSSWKNFPTFSADFSTKASCSSLVFMDYGLRGTDKGTISFNFLLWFVYNFYQHCILTVWGAGCVAVTFEEISFGSKNLFNSQPKLLKFIADKSLLPASEIW